MRANSAQIQIPDRQKKISEVCTSLFPSDARQGILIAQKMSIWARGFSEDFSRFGVDSSEVPTSQNLFDIFAKTRYNQFVAMLQEASGLKYY